MSDAVLTERARVQAEVEGRTLVDSLADTVRGGGDQPAYSDKHHVPEGESWRTLTWTETRELGARVAAGLIELGVPPVTPSRSWRPTGSSTSWPTSAPCTRRPPRCRSTTRCPTSRSRTSPAHAQPEGRDPRERRPPRAGGRGARGAPTASAGRGDRRRRGPAVTLRLGRPGGRRAAYRAAHPGEVDGPRRRAHPRLSGDDPLHVRHDRQPQGRGAHPPQRALRGDRDPGGGRTDRAADRGQLPAAGAHRRAGARPLRPADPGQPHARDRRPGAAARHPRRGAPDGVLRRAAGVGEDQDRPVRQARRRPRPGQPRRWSRTRWPPRSRGSRRRRSAA